ncbi:MAG TPA: glycoside hydrolase family 88 protein, partial [Candidatus Dormibacteraeota bacterium]|nr:glycoside hydrolase family 88 protein [Candidatus Dormibacteraeota bacterium]
VGTRIDQDVTANQTARLTYVDAIYMALPGLAGWGVAMNDPPALSLLSANFDSVRANLFNSSAGLWWRDSSWKFGHVYWARGNGWAIAAIVEILAHLSPSDPRRGSFVTVLTQMASALRPLQRADGFWNVDLTNPNDFGGPESSGTAFFTYAIAYGINQGLLDATTYLPVVESAWHGLTTIAVQADGSLGYVQGVGSGPGNGQPVGPLSTAAYGVGGFLLAASQVAKLAGLPQVGPPGRSTGVTAVADGSGGVQVSWQAPLDDGGAQVSAYAIYAYSPTGTMMLLTQNPGQMNIRGLNRAAWYTFTITAYNGQWGPWSSWAPWTWVT